MPDPTYTLSELAGLVDIHPRTIRSYIQQDLLRGPDTMGRNARYSDYHRKRLEAIKTLRSDYALPLDEIRRLVSLADIDEDIKIASLPLPPAPSSALDFVRARQAQGGQRRRGGRGSVQSAPASSPMMPSPEPAAAVAHEAQPLHEHATAGPIELLLLRIQTLTSDQRVAQRTHGEEWFRLGVTPDLEIHVRGELSPEQIRLFEQIADHFRHILLGGK